MRRQKKRQLKRRIGFAAIAVILFFIVVEILCRIAFPGITGKQPFGKFDNPHLEMSETYLHDPALFWKLRPNNKAYQVNADGYRGQAVPIKKQSNEFRVIVLGDSCTFGVGPTLVPADRTYSAVLQTLLQKALPDKKVTVLNFGCPGYSSFQGRLLLKNKGLKYKPNMVIAYFGINDSFGAKGFPDAQQRPLINPPVLPDKINAALRQCCLHESLVRVIYGMRLSVTKADESTQRVSNEEFHENLDAIAKLGKQNNFGVLFIDPPYLSQEQVISQSDHNIHAPRVDLYSAFAKAQKQGVEPLFGKPDNIHPNVQGHRIAAETIFAKLMESKPWKK